MRPSGSRGRSPVSSLRSSDERPKYSQTDHKGIALRCWPATLIFLPSRRPALQRYDTFWGVTSKVTRDPVAGD